MLELDLATVDPSVAGPRRPQDRVPLTELRDNFRTNFPDGLRALDQAGIEGAPAAGGEVDESSRRVVPGERPAVVRDRSTHVRGARRGPGGAGDGVGRRRPLATGRSTVEVDGQRATIRTGSVAIAAITSCTNTSNPTVMVGAGLLARNAVARGLRVAPTVKTSLAPGSKAVTGYLEAAGLMAPLETLGFALAGYGCTTCIGNSGPLDEPIAAGDRGERSRRRGRPVRQPQLRGPDPSARPGELSRLAAARRRVRPRRPGRHRPARPSRSAPAPTARRSSSPTSGPIAGRDPGGHRRLDRPGAVPPDVRGRLRRRRSLAGAADPRRRPLRLGPGARRTSPSRRSSTA